MKRLLLLLLILLWPPNLFGAQYIDDRIIPPGIARDSEINPSGETNAICISNNPGVTPAITLCSTLDLTGKTVLFKLPEYTVATLPASHPLAIVTDGTSSTDCTGGGGSTRVLCHWNGSAYAAIGGGGGVGDPGSNGIAVRSALNTLIAREITGTTGRIDITNGTGVSGNPNINTGSDIPIKSEANTFTGVNSFNSALIVPRKTDGTPSNGEVWVNNTDLKYKDNSGTIHILYRIGDPIVRLFLSSTTPTVNDDEAAGYLRSDIWINDNGTTSDPSDDTIYIAVSVLTGEARWVQISGIVSHASLTGLDADDHSAIYPYFTSGAGPPGSTGTRTGGFYFDTTNKKIYPFFGNGEAGKDPSEWNTSPVQFCYEGDCETYSDGNYAGGVVISSTDNTITGTATKAGSVPNEVVTINLALAPVTSYFVWEVAGCNNATASTGMDLPTSGAPTPTCFGTTTTQGTLTFADAATSTASRHFRLPSNWTGNVDVDLVWFANAASTNAVRWSVATSCLADGDAISTGPGSYNTASAENTAYTGTANQRKTTSFTSIAMTNCAAGETAYFQVSRVGADGGDTLTASAELLEVGVKIRRTPEL